MSVIIIAAALAMVAGMITLIKLSARRAGGLLWVSRGAGNFRMGYRYHRQSEHMELRVVVADELLCSEPAIER